jgi:NADPH:quinone reductase-like Zn-dependent oxidoreductase
MRLRRSVRLRSYHLDEVGSIDGLVLRSRAKPSPRPTEVLVRVLASSLNSRDTLVVHGRTSQPVRAGTVPLSDGAGEVVACGEQVGRVSVGDRVAGVVLPLWIGGRWDPRYWSLQLGGSLDGMLSEFAILDEDGLVGVPGHLSFTEAATLPLAGVTAWSAVTGASPVIAGNTVLVLGSGGVSIFALQFAKLFGARVIATTSTAEKAARLRELGADEVINYLEVPDWEEAVLELTGGRGVDRVIEVGGAATISKSLKATCAGGRVEAVGSVSGTAGTLDPRALLGRGITVESVTLGSRERFEEMNRAIDAGCLHPLIDRVFAFDEAKDAFRYLESARHVGKIAIEHC